MVLNMKCYSKVLNYRLKYWRMVNQDISLSDELYKQLSERADATGHESTNQYVVFILEEVIHQLGDIETGIDQDEVEGRLKALGYVE